MLHRLLASCIILACCSQSCFAYWTFETKWQGSHGQVKGGVKTEYTWPNQWGNVPVPRAGGDKPLNQAFAQGNIRVRMIWHGSVTSVPRRTLVRVSSIAIAESYGTRETNNGIGGHTQDDWDEGLGLYSKYIKGGKLITIYRENITQIDSDGNWGYEIPEAFNLNAIANSDTFARACKAGLEFSASDVTTSLQALSEDGSPIYLNYRKDQNGERKSNELPFDGLDLVIPGRKAYQETINDENGNFIIINHPAGWFGNVILQCNGMPFDENPGILLGESFPTQYSWYITGTNTQYSILEPNKVTVRTMEETGNTLKPKTVSGFNSSVSLFSPSPCEVTPNYISILPVRWHAVWGENWEKIGEDYLVPGKVKGSSGMVNAQTAISIDATPAELAATIESYNTLIGLYSGLGPATGGVGGILAGAVEGPLGVGIAAATTLADVALSYLGYKLSTEIPQPGKIGPIATTIEEFTEDIDLQISIDQARSSGQTDEYIECSLNKPLPYLRRFPGAPQDMAHIKANSSYYFSGIGGTPTVRGHYGHWTWSRLREADEYNETGFSGRTRKRLITEETPQIARTWSFTLNIQGGTPPPPPITE